MASKIDSLESKQQTVGETNYDTYTSTFQCLIQHEQNNNMLYLCNELYDMLFTFKNITKSSMDELEYLLSGYCNDDLFNEFIIKFFSNGLNTYSFKSNIQSISSFPNISVQSALNVLDDVFKSAHSEQIKRYVLFLTVPIENVFNQASEKFSELNIYNGAFYQYLVEYIKKYINKKLLTNQLDKHSMFCLVSFICQNDDSTEALPAKLKYINIDMDYTKCDSFNDVWKQLLNNYDALHANKTTGFNLNGSFENSVKLFSYIAPIWDNLSATFTLLIMAFKAASSEVSFAKTISFWAPFMTDTASVTTSCPSLFSSPLGVPLEQPASMLTAIRPDRARAITLFSFIWKFPPCCCL